MNVPNFLNEKVVDQNGNWTDPWRIVISQLLSQLKLNFSDQGFLLPPQKTSFIAGLTNAPNGTIIYDSDISKGKIKENGVFKTITTS